MDKILLILESDTTEILLTEALDGYEVRSCRAEAASGVLARFQPDALVLDLFLPGNDGFGIMESCRENLPPIVLLLSDLTSEYVLQKAASLGADFVIEKPCTIVHIVNQLEDMMMFHQFPNPSDNRAIAEHLLEQFPISARESVLHAFCSAVLFSAENPECALTKEIYLTVCKEYGESTDALDQAFRRSLRKAWKRSEGKAPAWKRFFPEYDRCPPNGIFISTLGRFLRKKFPSRFREGERLS